MPEPTRRVRRPRAGTALSSALTLTLVLVAGCGGVEEATEEPAGSASSSGASAGEGAVDGLTVSGDVGSAPEVAWDGEVDVDASAASVLVEGEEGEPLTDGQTVVAHVYVANATAQEKAFSTYDQDSPVALPVDPDQLNPALYQALAGRVVGSRVQVVTPPQDAFGPAGNPDAGIGADDDVLFVVDLVQRVLDGPAGTPQDPPADAPLVEERDGTPTGIDFTAAPDAPPDQLQVITLVRGDGREVQAGDDTVMNYLGQVYGRDQVFDQSFDAEPFRTTIGTGAVIRGWDQGLVGLPVGSRVLLVIPPGLAYGEQAQGDIPAGATLAFVVDVLAAY